MPTKTDKFIMCLLANSNQMQKQQSCLHLAPHFQDWQGEGLRPEAQCNDGERHLGEDNSFLTRESSLYCCQVKIFMSNPVLAVYVFVTKWKHVFVCSFCSSGNPASIIRKLTSFYKLWIPIQYNSTFSFWWRQYLKYREAIKDSKKMQYLCFSFFFF